MAFLSLPHLQISSTTFFSATNLNLFLIFLKIGAIHYGGGYVLFAFLDTELVSTGLLSRQLLIDAIAVGQFTPGPVFFLANIYKLPNQQFVWCNSFDNWNFYSFVCFYCFSQSACEKNAKLKTIFRTP